MKPICLGAGFIALDVVMNGGSNSPSYLTTGGSCGNVMSILAYLGWDAAPMARLSNDKAASVILADLAAFGVNQKFITTKQDGSTPIIIQRILKDNAGTPKHKFEFRDPENGKWLPQYKPVLTSYVDTIELHNPSPRIYYFDRANPGTIELAKKCKDANALIFFEPNSVGDIRLFKIAVAISDVIKFSSDRIKNYDEIISTHRCPLEIRTLGREGLEYSFRKPLHARNWKRLNPIQLDQKLVKDPSGAGDWCSAGIITGLGPGGAKSFNEFQETEIVSALNIGQSYSALSICFTGARGLMYHLDNEQFYDAINSILDSSFSEFKELVSGQIPSRIHRSSRIQISSLYTSK